METGGMKGRRKEMIKQELHEVLKKGFGVEKLDAAIIAAGAVLHYISSAEHHNTSHVSTVQRIEKERMTRKLSYRGKEKFLFKWKKRINSLQLVQHFIVH